MRRTNETSHTGYAVAMSVVALLAAPIPAAAGGTGLRLVDNVAERRLQVTFGVADSTAGRVVAGGRVPQGLMAHRFLVEATDALGNGTAMPTGWQVALSGGRTLRPLVHLSGDVAEVNLPRPLGIRLAAADSIDVVAHLPSDSGSTAVYLRVTIEYEPVEQAASRLGVVTVSVASDEGPAATRWEWQSDASGRLLAIAGFPMRDVVSLMLVDVASGDTLWRSPDGGRAAFGTPNAVVRLGVAVEGGRRYAITASFAPGHRSARRSVVAMMLPSR